MEIEEWACLLLLGLNGCFGAVVGLENGWKLGRGPEYASIGALSGVTIAGYFLLLVGGTLPWVNTWAFGVISLAGGLSGLSTYFAVRISKDFKTGAYISAGAISFLTAFFTVYLLGLKL